MRTLDARTVRFGELAGALAHGAVFFDWQLVSTQEFAEAVGYPFERLMAANEIPYAPAAARTRIDRYPTVGDQIAVETTPVQVGNHRIVLQYEFLDSMDKPFGVGRIPHVTISPNGRAKPLPKNVRARANDRVPADSSSITLEFDAEPPVSKPTYHDSFRIRRPLIEGSELAYFEEYPRLATIALERFLEEQGVSLLETTDEYPFRLRRWDWRFNSPIAYGTTLDVNATVVDVSEDAVLVAHSFEQGDRVRIVGWTEYGCFDEDGAPIAFDEHVTSALSTD